MSAKEHRSHGLLSAGAVIVLMHGLWWWLLDADIGINSALLCANLFALWCGFRIRREFGGRRALIYATGYLVLFLHFNFVAHSPLLLVAFGMLYCATFRVPLLLGFVLALIISITLLPSYWFGAALLLGVLYAVILGLWRKQRQKRFHLACFTFGFLLVIVVVLPLLYLSFQTSPQTLMSTMGNAQFRGALATSVITSTITTLVVLICGLPLAYGLVRLEFPGKRLIESLIDLPIVIPHTVAGIALLVVLGPRTPAGTLWRDMFGFDIADHYIGIIICQVFVSSPFLVRSAMNAFRDMGPALENASRTLGASSLSTFFRVSLPLASGSIFTGCILTWARAISEVGSLSVLAYQPYTASTYSYELFVQHGLKEAQPAAVVLVIVCLWGFLVLQWLRGASLPQFLRPSSGGQS